MHDSQGVAYDCRYAVVWCTKYRRKVLREEIACRLEDILTSVAGEINAQITDLQISSEIVRMRISIDPQFGINRAVRHLKSVSSRILRSEFPELKSRIPCLWTGNYFVVTEASVRNMEPLIKEFIRKQERSQRKSTTKQEEV